MDRRGLMKMGAGAVVTGIVSSASAARANAGNEQPMNEKVEQWGVFEVKAQGPSAGNPFVDVQFGARFALGHRSVEAAGFYDGKGVYKVRFSPDMVGRWSFETASNVSELAGLTGGFECVAPATDNRGPVGTAHQFHFQYAEGTPYFPFGTTCYSYGFIGAPYGDETLKNLKEAGFNKVRICLLPKGLGKLQPAAMPFERIGEASPPGTENLEDNGASKEKFDLARFNPAYFEHFESRIQDLMAAGIEADVILFHPYDAWGFKAMGQEADDRYLRYAVARLSAYRNVWWSIANEYDLVRAKTMADWDRFFRIVQECDPYSRLRSIHHSRVVYDHSKPWCTHASLQEYDFEKSPERMAAWNKPIVYDEIQYEGNISRRWGNLSPEEMTHRFWRAIVYGVYATHGETYMATDGSPVWSDAGELHGTSAARITFLRKLLEKSGTTGLMASENPYYLNAGNPGAVILYYFDYHCVGEYEFPLPEKVAFKATMIDPWAMTESPLPGTFSGKSKITLSGKPYMAVLFEKA
ncbi:MAG: DUF5060 domain-containing protein [Terracidiphilus sp.]|nr:DUF5060 domain-containing protein [Terracidiphilus sp.]MDR3796793.1 DUF5060 domain-containing protein [Terracidiphilus sp.]